MPQCIKAFLANFCIISIGVFKGSALELFPQSWTNKGKLASIRLVSKSCLSYKLHAHYMLSLFILLWRSSCLAWSLKTPMGIVIVGQSQYLNPIVQMRYYRTKVAKTVPCSLQLIRQLERDVCRKRLLCISWIPTEERFRTWKNLLNCCVFQWSDKVMRTSCQFPHLEFPQIVWLIPHYTIWFYQKGEWDSETGKNSTSSTPMTFQSNELQFSQVQSPASLNVAKHLVSLVTRGILSISKEALITDFQISY